MRVVLVHGSVGNGPATWGALQPLEGRFTHVVPNRGGYPPNPPLEQIDFELQADELAPLLEEGGPHLVGHSYGGLISLLIRRCGARLRGLPARGGGSGGWRA